MAKAGEEEVRERERAKDISFGKREIGEEEESSCVGFFSEHKILVPPLGRCGRMSCKLVTKLMFPSLLVVGCSLLLQILYSNMHITFFFLITTISIK